MKQERRYFEIAEMTIEVSSDLAIKPETFDARFDAFAVGGPGADTVRIAHHFELPALDEARLGREVYRRSPWAIYQNDRGYAYLWISPTQHDNGRRRVAFFNTDHRVGEIFNDRIRRQQYLNGGIGALTLFPTDQILLARLLADRQGCMLHAAAVILDGAGCLFVGHSDAGKSTIASMLKARGEILCDDRNIVRRTNRGFRLYGSWSHGDLPDVSAASAELRGIFFLHQAAQNRITAVADRQVAVRHLLACVIKPFVTADWWENTLVTLDRLAREVPCHTLYFDRSAKIVDKLYGLEELWV